jgi:hypothetical protein
MQPPASPTPIARGYSPKTPRRVAPSRIRRSLQLERRNCRRRPLRALQVPGPHWRARSIFFKRWGFFESPGDPSRLLRQLPSLTTFPLCEKLARTIAMGKRHHNSRFRGRRCFGVCAETIFSSVIYNSTRGCKNPCCKSIKRRRSRRTMLSG